MSDYVDTFVDTESSASNVADGVDTTTTTYKRIYIRTTINTVMDNYGTPFYVDNGATGTNDGTSWENAWESFADINWTTLANTSLAHLYISGGSVSKTYSETMTVGASGTESDFIVIDVGANSPFPTGHAGTVIIDGGDIRVCGILMLNRNYIRVYGYDSSDDYQLKIQNVVSPAGGGQSGINLYQCNYVYIDYVEVVNDTCRGIYLNECNNSRVHGCYVHTGEIDTDYETDCIYLGYGVDDVIENNICIEGNRDTNLNHCDAFQCAKGTRHIVRNNWFEWLDGAVDPYETACVIEDITEYMYFYNNVVLGSDSDQEKVCIFKSSGVDPTAKYYIWNNTFVAQHPNGGVFQAYSWTYDHLGALQNNVFYSANGLLVWFTAAVTINPASKINYNCSYRASGTNIGAMGGTGYSWANWRALGFEANGINSDPKLTALYRLNADSPCLNAGADLSAYFTTDKDGTLRPVGAAWDMGAYEYG